MEYVEGQTLHSLREELERVPEELCRHIAREVAQGLVAIHAADVIHRDIKPANVLITPDHQIKVMDLGIARLQDEAIRLSQTGHFVGSMQYAAPEQFDYAGDGVTASTDLHGLGVLLYELASGQCPYAGDDMKQLIHQITSVEPRRLGDLNPQLSPFFEELVHTLLAKKAADRFASAAVFLEVLVAGTDSDWWHEREIAIHAETAQPLRRIRIPRDTAVYGRDDELAKLRSLYDHAAAGEGQVLLVEGEAGIGKSRLIDEFVVRLQADGEDLNFLFGSYSPGGTSSATGAFSTAFREHFGAGSSANHLTQMPLLVPAFDAVLRGVPAPKDALALTKESLGTCFVHATCNLAAERTTLIFVDDLHFAPEEARALFLTLALAIPDEPVLLVGTARPGGSQAWVASLSRMSHATRIPLERLGAKDLALLLNDRFQSEQLAQHLAHEIGIKSDGNPFFVFEIIRGLQEGQFISQRDDGSWVSTGAMDKVEIPSSILDLVNARVADLTEEERDILDLACCWGFEFDPTLIGDALEMARIPALKRLAHIERKHRLVRAVGEHFVFDHHQVQEALYGALPPALAREYHAALAETLEARTNASKSDPSVQKGSVSTALCEHFLKAEQGQRAMAYFESAQAYLEKNYLLAHAATLTERVLGVPQLVVDSERVEKLISFAGMLRIFGDRERQRAVVEEAGSLAKTLGDDALHSKALHARGQYYLDISSMEEVWSALDESLELARVSGDSEAEMNAVSSMGNAFFRAGRFDESRTNYERALELSRQIGDPDAEAGTLVNIGNPLFMTGRFQEAQATWELGAAACQKIGNSRFEGNARGNLGNVHLSLGRYAQAYEQYSLALSKLQETGFREGEAMLLGNLAGLEVFLGQLEAARLHFNDSLRVTRAIGRLQEGSSLTGLGWLHEEMGNREEARRYYQDGLQSDREIQSPYHVAIDLIALTSFERRQGCHDQAREYLDEASTLSQELNVAEVMLPLAIERAYQGTGSIDHVLRQLSEHQQSIRGYIKVSARFNLWELTHETPHLVEAHRLLEDLLDHAPEECRESMIENVRVNRKIMAAWAEHGADS